MEKLLNGCQMIESQSLLYHFLVSFPLQYLHMLQHPIFFFTQQHPPENTLSALLTHH